MALRNIGGVCEAQIWKPGNIMSGAERGRPVCAVAGFGQAATAEPCEPEFYCAALGSAQNPILELPDCESVAHTKSQINGEYELAVPGIRVRKTTRTGEPLQHDVGAA